MAREMAQVDLLRWRGHVRQAMEQKQSFAQYAREHGMSRHTLYAASKTMKMLGELPDVPYKPDQKGLGQPRRSKRAAFIPLHVQASSKLVVQLRNGVELRFDSVQGLDWMPLMSALGSVPCSV